MVQPVYPNNLVDWSITMEKGDTKIDTINVLQVFH